MGYFERLNIFSCASYFTLVRNLELCYSWWCFPLFGSNLDFERFLHNFCHVCGSN